MQGGRFFALQEPKIRQALSRSLLKYINATSALVSESEQSRGEKMDIGKSLNQLKTLE